MTKDDALKLALEAMYPIAYNTTDDPRGQANKAITAIKEALAQHNSVQAKPEPEQEPVAYVNVEKRRLEFAHDYVKWDTPTTIKLDKIPLYTTPPQRKPLTDEQIDEEFKLYASKFDTSSDKWLDMGADDYFKAGFKAAHGIKE